MEPIIRIQFTNGYVTIDYARADEREIYLFVMTCARHMLTGTPDVEKLIETYGSIELIFLVAQYYRHHQSLVGFPFPKDYEVPNFMTLVMADAEDEGRYHIAMNCEEPACANGIIAVTAGLLLGAFDGDIVSMHFSVHEMVALYIDQAYKGDEEDEDRNIINS